MAIGKGQTEGVPCFEQQPLESASVPEGESFALNVKVEPAGDNSLQVEWYKDGRVLPAASRYTTAFDRGYAVLEFLYCFEEDTGDYKCIVVNKSGKAESSACKLTVTNAEEEPASATEMSSMMSQNLAAIEASTVQSQRSNKEKQFSEPASITQQPQSPGDVAEGTPAVFQCSVTPADDPSMQIEWLRDGKPVGTGCRFNASYDRGLAMLSIAYCYAEDSGSYICVAKNNAGKTESSSASLSCMAEDRIVTKSSLSKDSVAYLEGLDNCEHVDSHMTEHICAVAEEEIPAPPQFVITPKPAQVIEGEGAKFLVKVDGFPVPKIQWFLNDEPVQETSLGGHIRIHEDGGISNFEYHRCQIEGTYTIKVIAKNDLGEVQESTQLVVAPLPDYRPGLKHVTPENAFKKLAALKKVGRSDELVKKMTKPKAKADDLLKLESLIEAKSRTVAAASTVEVENLYARTQQALKAHRQQSSAPAPKPPKPQTATVQLAEPQMEHDETSADFTIEL